MGELSLASTPNDVADGTSALAVLDLRPSVISVVTRRVFWARVNWIASTAIGVVNTTGKFSDLIYACVVLSRYTPAASTQLISN